MYLVGLAVLLSILNLIMIRLLVLDHFESISGPAFAFCFTVFVHFLFLLSIWALLKCWLSDPGYIPGHINASQLFEDCDICGVPKPPRAHHCRRCARCVFRMDHHCAWIGNCVGYSNQKHFILLLSYLVILGSGTALAISAILFKILLGEDRLEFWQTVLRILFLVLNAAVAIYARIYLREQIESLETNTTLIETYQGSHGDPNVNTFGQIFGLCKFFWFFPMDSSLRPDYSEQVIGSRKVRAVDADSLGILVDRVRDVDKID